MAKGGSPGKGGDDASSLMLTHLTSTMHELENKRIKEAEVTDKLQKKVDQLAKDLQREMAGRNEAEECVVMLKEESEALRAELEQAKGTLGNLETQEQSRFEATIAEEREQHKEEIAKMKQQMSGVMEKVMKEWDRVKKAAKKSVSVEEWLRLEDELKRAEKKNEELLAAGAGAGGGGVGAPAGPAKVDDASPDVYGHTMASVITNVEQLHAALKAHGSDWRAKGDVLAPASDAIARAVQSLNGRYDQLHQQSLALDRAVEDLVAQAAKAEIPEAVVERLNRAIKDGYEELKNCKQVKASPEEVVAFMDRVVASLNSLATQLANAERDYCDKANEVVEAERDARMQLQTKNEELRANIKKVPETMRTKLNIQID